MEKIKRHPFKPEIPENAAQLIIGTLPPETATFYFSNSPNTRLWDILKSVSENEPTVGRGGYQLPNNEKISILHKLKLGISDIILTYKRDPHKPESVRDTDIIPYEYNDLLTLAREHKISKLIFVYESALKWFLHSLTGESPLTLNKMQGKYTPGLQQIHQVPDEFQIILLPNPLSRGTKGMTLEKKLSLYKQFIS